MKLNQIYVRQYGPVQKDLELQDNINVVRGPNESGKSLLVEALLKKLSDGTIPNTVVEETPEGFIEITDGQLNTTLRDGDSLAEFCEENFSQDVRSEELRNVFVIRRGDLSFNEDDEFYSHITDKLTGRRVEDIEEVKDALIDEGRLTPGRYNVSSDQSYNDAGTQLEEARELKKHVKSYITEAESDNIDRAEADLYEAEREISRLKEKVEKLEKARNEAEKQARYNDLQEEKNTLEENLDELDKLPDNDNLEEIDDRLQELSEKKGKQGELEDRKERSLSLSKWSIGGAVASLGILLFAGFPVVGVLATVAFVIGSGYYWTQSRRFSDDLAEIGVKEQDIISEARALGLEFGDKREIRSEIDDIRSDREELEDDNQGRKAVLTRELDFQADSMREVVDTAEEKLEDLEADIDDSIEVEFDQEEYDQADEKLQVVKDRRDELDQKLQDHREKLRNFHDRAHELNFSIFVGERLDLEIKNLDALGKLEDRLGEFISAIEEDAEASRIAIEIFEEIQEEEKEETAELFEEGSRASEIFQSITDNRYTTVTYDNESNDLMVEKSTGESFTPRELSDGTKDQLYLSIRVALGEKILEGNTGFFVMDDAFLTSDASRLETQADVVERLAEEGWQIIYLSSKEDAITVLSDRTDNEVIELQALE